MLLGLTLATALACALVAGVFFAFSTFVMRALARQPALAGIAAMQAINVTVINPAFMGLFLGAALACAGLLIAAFAGGQGLAQGGLLVGTLAYLVGCFGVTMAFNVPRNDRLAKLRADDAQAEAEWRDYLREWTRWNHVRCAASAFAAAALVHAAWPLG